MQHAKRKIAEPTEEEDKWGNKIYNIVTDDVNLGYAYLMQNCAYIKIPEGTVAELFGSSSGGAKVSFVFEDDLLGEISNGIATGISETNNQVTKKLEWYSLDGRKLNGVPTEKGLYIANGKKVMVK